MKLSINKAWIYLENGTFLEANSFGAKSTVVGEIVFNTSLTGYQEIISDPLSFYWSEKHEKFAKEAVKPLLGYQVKVKQNAMRKIKDSDAENMEVIASAVIQLVCVDTSTLKPKAFPDWLFLAE